MPPPPPANDSPLARRSNAVDRVLPQQLRERHAQLVLSEDEALPRAHCGDDALPPTHAARNYSSLPHIKCTHQQRETAKNAGARRLLAHLDGEHIQGLLLQSRARVLLVGLALRRGLLKLPRMKRRAPI